jgi:hypothetical protein
MALSLDKVFDQSSGKDEVHLVNQQYDRILGAPIVVDK